MWFLLACTTPAWHGARVVLSAESDVVTFAPTPLGTTGSATVTLHNDGGAAAQVDITVVGPFTPDRDALELAAGDQVDLGLRFTPTDYGTQVGTLHLFVDGQTALELSVLASAAVDSDGDGYNASAVAGDDCDDADPDVHPGAADACYDGLDADCAGDDDQDCDHDGVRVDQDCDDARADIFPDAAELDDGADQDCDGRIDEDFILVGDVILTEIHPAFPAWVEVCATRTVHLDGWTLAGQPIPVAAATPDTCAVLCERADTGCTATLPIDLDETADTLTLTADAPMDTVTWDAAWTYTSGRTRSLSPDALDVTANDAAAAWCVSDGSPGSPNPPC